MHRVAMLIPVCCLVFAALVVPGAARAAESGDVPPAAARKDFPGIAKLMTAEDFARAGLDQLTPEQLQSLDAWLVRYTAGDAYVVQHMSEEVRAAAPEFRIEASVVPPFTGWSGETLFRLDNGQVWRQRIKGRYVYSGEDTRVVITRNFLGFYMLTVAASGRSIGIEPVRKGGGSRSP